MKRYGLIIFPENRYGQENLGVTAFSAIQATSLAREELRKLTLAEIADDEINRAEIVGNIDIRESDQNHVIPNMGVVSREGMWLPN